MQARPGWLAPGGPLSPARVEPLAESISNEEVCRPPSPVRLGWPDRAYGPARSAALVRLNCHSEAYCHADPNRLVRARADSLDPAGSLCARYEISQIEDRSTLYSICKHHKNVSIARPCRCES
jgi:hypothetical protein